MNGGRVMCVLVCSAGDLYTARSAAALVAETGDRRIERVPQVVPTII